MLLFFFTKVENSATNYGSRREIRLLYAHFRQNVVWCVDVLYSLVHGDI